MDMGTSRTTTAEMAGARPAATSHLEDICNSCLKPMLSCACKRTRRTNVVTRTTIDDTPMEDVEEVSTRSHTTLGNNIIPPPGLPTASASTAVHPQVVQDPLQPQTVQDPLHTGLPQSLQTASTADVNNNHSPNHSPTTSTTTTRNYDPRQMYTEFVEDEFTRSGELITAAYATQGRTSVSIPTWDTLATATDTTAIRSLLAALAFDTESTDPWNTLGLSRLEGPKPNVLMLQSRRDVAWKLIDSCTPSLHEPGRQEMTNIIVSLNKACDYCCANLETNTLQRRNLKGSNRNVPRWMEPSEDMLDHLTTQMPPNGRLALHLSNLTNTEITTYPGAMDVNTTRQLHSHLCGPLDEIERILTRWGDQPLLTWAPTDNGQLLRVAAAVRSIHNSRAGHAPLILAIPLDPYPACEKVSDITDVWDHPLLHAKWKDIVVDVTLLIPPTRIVVSGTHAPIHAQKCISLFTLGQPQAQALPKLSAWRTNFFNFATGPTINIDTPLQFQHAVKAVVTSLGLPALQTIDQPRTSLGNTKDMPRTTLHLHFETGKITSMHMEALLKWLSNALKDFQAIVGVQSTMASPTAMLVDVMSPAAGFTHSALSWSTLVISPRLLLVETRTDAPTWNSDLTAAWEINPTMAGIKVRYRPSTMLKPLFAQVEATAADIAAVRTRKSQSYSKPTLDNPSTLQATISMPLGTCGPSELWLPLFMQQVATVNNLPLQASTSDTGLDIHRWKAVTTYDGAWTGKVIVQLSNIQGLHQVRRTLHGQGVEIQHHLAGIYVDSDHINLSSRATATTTQSS